MPAGFVGLLSIFNLAGRFFWSSLSDRLGRKRTYMIYFGLGAVLYVLAPNAGRRAQGPGVHGQSFVMAALLVAGFACNAAVRAVNAKHHMKE